MVQDFWTLPLVKKALAIAGLSLLLLAIYNQLDISGDLLRSAGEAADFTRTHKFWGLLILFIWSFVLFLTVAPLGSVTILAAGFLLGPLAGIVQFLSLCLASWVVHLWTHPGQRQAAYQQIVKNPKVMGWIECVRRSPVLTVSVLRLIPVVPSCVCVLACSGLGIAGKHLFWGTALTGWVRPVFFAIVGAQAVSLIDILQKSV